MERSFRSFALLFAAFLGLMIICAGFTFLLYGDDLIDFTKTALVRFSVALREDDLDKSAGGDATPVRFLVNSGDTPSLIANNLQAAGLITDSGLFVDYVRAEKLDSELEAGVYFLNQTQTLREIALALTDSSFSQITFIIYPGERLEEVAARIDSDPMFGFSGAEFLAVVEANSIQDPIFAQRVGLPAGASLEGFLYPDTYNLPPDITPILLRDLLTDAFLLAVSEQTFQDAVRQGLTMYQAVTLASIIQREAVHSDEMPLISSVYHNRLDIGQKLDADPTVQYALDGTRNDQWWPRLIVNAVQNDYADTISDYNTYLNLGLPPGPIASPALPAIEAAIHPVESAFFYFRADCRSDGYHDFSETFEEHSNRC